MGMLLDGPAGVLAQKQHFLLPGGTARGASLT